MAGFIGVSNLMPGEVVSTGTGSVELRLDAGPTVRAGAAGATVGERAHAVVRPEKLQLHPANGTGPDGRPSVDGQVESSLYLGTATQVIVRLPDDTRMTVLVPNTDEEARRRLPAAGDGARLTWSTENIHMVRPAAERPDEEGTRERPRAAVRADHQRGDQPPAAARPRSGRGAQRVRAGLPGRLRVGDRRHAARTSPSRR